MKEDIEALLSSYRASEKYIQESLTLVGTNTILEVRLADIQAFVNDLEELLLKHFV